LLLGHFILEKPQGSNIVVKPALAHLRSPCDKDRAVKYRQ
jgi:hypothetical protein